MPIHVLLVDDDPDDLKQLERDLPAVFKDAQVDAVLHPTGDFDEALAMADDSSRRFDLILSDTYKGPQAKHEAAVLQMVTRYRGNRFCPLVVFSASAAPETLELGPFLLWADKAESKSVEQAITKILSTGVPQVARALHDELDRGAGSYLWSFLEKHWDALSAQGHVAKEALGRLVRRRAALQMAEIAAGGSNGAAGPVVSVHGAEFYVYPPLNPGQLSLGEVIQSRTNPGDFRVVMTPHCLLAIQENQTKPRAEYVKTVMAFKVKDVVGESKLKTAREADGLARDKKIRKLVTPPSGESVGKPDGRYWYLPSFLEIPHLYCDFFRVETVAYEQLRSEYKSIAVLAPPYAESLQACYVAFHAAVGIPNLLPASVSGLLE